MASPLVENGVAILEFARRVTMAFLEDVPEDKMCHAPFPGANHAIWLIGHVTLVDDDLPHRHGGVAKECPEQWQHLFGMGSAPLPERSSYPPTDELIAQFGATRIRLIEWYRSLPEARLLEPLQGESANFAPNLAGMMATIACHECLHAGQLRVITQNLGQPPKFG